jgi:beta-galactosidase
MQKLSFNKDWQFWLNPAGESHYKFPTDVAWQSLNLPHDWSIALDRAEENPSGSSNGFFTMGRGFYTKKFEALSDWQDQQVLIEFEGVYMNAEVWLNEDFLGRHPYGYTTFTFDLSPYLRFGQENTLRVMVDNSGQLNSRWYSGSGIYRPVWLLVSDRVHIAHWGTYVTTPQVDSDHAQVLVQTRVRNTSDEKQVVTLLSRILSPNGEMAAHGDVQAEIAAGEEHEFTQSIQVAHPQLWSTDTPHLYKLNSEVRAGDRKTDTQATTFGIRTLSFDAHTGFQLNGQPLKLKGGCVHHDNGVLGAAAYARAEERKVEIHKANGYNAIRTAHNPPSPAFLDACDRLGMLVMDESFDCWREGKNPFDYHTAFDDWWQRDVQAMVLRDRNHPSIIIWSIGNEIMERDGRSNGVQVATMLAKEVKRLDPTRPVAAAICGIWDQTHVWEDTDGVFDVLGIGGYNYQWQQYQSDHERHPERIMAGTESFPMEAFVNWECVLELDYVIGDFVWTSLDYLGEAGIGREDYADEGAPFLPGWPWHQAYCGDLDLCGFKRPQSYYRDLVWEWREPLYIAVHPPIPAGKTPRVSLWGWPDAWENWNFTGSEGQNLNVQVYSRSEEVELFLNGRSLGRKPAGKAQRFIAAFDGVPYEPGELKAVAYDRGTITAEKALQTTSAPAEIRLSPDRAGLRLESEDGTADLSYVTVEVVDDQERMVPDAEHLIRFSISGPGEIAAVGSGNPTTTESYVGNERKAFRGRALVVVKTTGESGLIRLTAESEGLTSADVELKAGC